MTKQEFLASLASLYRVGNASDSDDSPDRESWTKPEMAGKACCAAIDNMTWAMLECGVLTADERQAFYDTL